MIMNRLKRVLAVAFAGLALTSLAKTTYYSFDENSMSSLGKGSKSGYTLTAESGSDLDYCADSSKAPQGSWCIGAKITWPNGGKGSTADGAKHELSSGGMSSYSDETKTVRIGSTWLSDATCVISTTWYVWITPEEAYAVNGSEFSRWHKMSGRAQVTGYDNGVPEQKFTINIPTAKLELVDNNGIKWFPALALIGDKVYGDVAAAVAAGGTINFVANATAERTDFPVGDGVTLNLNGKTLTIGGGRTMSVTGGAINGGTLAVNGGTIDIAGGTFDFEPPKAFIRNGYSAKQQGTFGWLLKTTSTNG